MPDRTFSPKWFLKGYNSQDSGVNNSGSDSPSVPILQKLSQLGHPATAFEIAVSIPIKPEIVISAYNLIRESGLIDVQGQGEKAILSITPKGKKFLADINMSSEAV